MIEVSRRKRGWVAHCRTGRCQFDTFYPRDFISMAMEELAIHEKDCHPCISVFVPDVELVMAVYASGQPISQEALNAPHEHEHDPDTGACLLAPGVKEMYELVEGCGATIALRIAREKLQAAGLDIADRPIYVKSAVDNPSLGGVKFHVLTPIVVLPEDKST